MIFQTSRYPICRYKCATNPAARSLNTHCGRAATTNEHRLVVPASVASRLIMPCLFSFPHPPSHLPFPVSFPFSWLRIPQIDGVKTNVGGIQGEEGGRITTGQEVGAGAPPVVRNGAAVCLYNTPYLLLAPRLFPLPSNLSFLVFLLLSTPQ